MATRPTVAVDSNAVTATSVPYTLTGTAGVSYTVRLLSADGTTIEDTDVRTGSGTGTLTPAGGGRKFVQAYQTTVASANPSNMVEVTVPSTSAADLAWYRVMRLDRLPGSPYMRVVVERREKAVEP